MATDYAERSRALVGTRFRPQGRSETELDCVGVVLSTFGLANDTVRRDYRMRGDHRSEIESKLMERFRRVPKAQLRTGDVMLLEIATEQMHLAVRTERGFVHGHAGIGRVVETPGLPEWRLLGVYRKRRER